MMNLSFLALFAVAAVAAALLSDSQAVAEGACVPTELTPCLPAITGGSYPTTSCCAKLKDQQPCFCQYQKDPNLRQYVTSPNAKKMATECRVSIPTC